MRRGQTQWARQPRDKVPACPVPGSSLTLIATRMGEIECRTARIAYLKTLKEKGMLTDTGHAFCMEMFCP